MKMDFSKFKKVHSDKRKTTLMHPSGHKIVIAREALNKENLDQLDRLPKSYQYQPGMAEGGDVAPADSDIFANNSRAIGRRMMGKPKEDASDFGEDEFTGDDVEALDRGESLQGPVVKDQEVGGRDIQSFAEGGDAIANSRRATGITKAEGAAIDAAPVPSDQVSAQNQGTVGSASPLAEPVDDSYVPPQSTAGTPIAPYPAYKVPPGGANDPYAVANKTALQAIQKQQEGAQQTAVATGEAASQMGAANSMAADVLNRQATQFQASYDKLQKDRQALFADWQGGHIDPQHYVNSMSTGKKIMQGIGLVLGGMGSGMSHQPNLAFDYLNKQIDHDIDAQKSTLQNKNNLLNANLAATGDLFQAAGITKMQTLDINAMHLKQIAANTTDPIQRAQLLTTSGQLDEKASQIQAQIAQREALMQTYGKDGEDNFQQRMRLLKVMGQDKFAEDTEKRHVPGVGNASREVPEDIIKQINARNTLNEAVQDLQNFAKQNSGSINPAAMAQGRAKAALVQDMVRQASNSGVFKESEKDFMNRYVGEDPTQMFNKYRAGKGYEEVRRNNLLNLNDLKKSYGLPVSQGDSKGAAGTPNIQTRGGIPYMKVPGGWKRIK